MSMELVEFLKARLDEDEEAAQAAMEGSEGRWEQDDPERYPGRIFDDHGEPVSYDEGHPTAAQAAHIVRHDPARVLCDVEAKRQMIRVFTERYRACWDQLAATIHGKALNDVLRFLALPYANHENYREEWRPADLA